MPIPIGTIRNASTPGDDIVQIVRRALPPAGQRAEAIQKLLDMLGRHLSGKEVLPRDALVRLIEDLARVLKFPPLPQETGRAFLRRLVEVVESLPLPQRLAIERQLGGGGLARRLAALTQSGPSAGPGNPTTPLPAGQPGIRNLPLQLPVSPHFAAAQTPLSGDPALLQAILRKTFGADDDGASAALPLEDAPQAPEPGETAEPAPDRGSTPTARHTPTPISNGDIAAPTASGGTAEGVAAAEAMPPAPADTSESAAAAQTGDEALPPRFEGGGAAGHQPEVAAPDERPNRTFGEAEAVSKQGTAVEADAFEADGTYGPTGANGNDARQPAEAPTPPEALPESPLDDAAEALLEGSLDLPDIVAEERQALVARAGEQEPEPTRAPPAPHERLPGGPRPDSARMGTEPIAEPIVAEKTETPSGGPPSAQRQAPAGEEFAMQQAIALLVESGLPEIIPFAMVPYLPAQEEADDEHDRSGGYPRGDGGTESEDGEEQKDGQDPESDGDNGAEPEASDAYDLYRKLGDLV
jgi:hypothetical protein